MNRKVLLTISILISNRPDTVRKCLDSIKPLLDHVSSELILVDTGCGEQVRKIIEEYTDKIVEFEWCRDFARARNAGLEKASGEWFLFLDDDEWFEDVTDIIHFFNSGEYKGYGMAAYTQRNYLEKDGSVYTDLLVGRMTKLYPDTRFIYRIHEYFNHVRGCTRKLNAYVHHYGYIYDSPREAREHSLRNISLLLEEHKADPGNMKHTLQLAQEYNVIEEYNKSLDMSLEAIALSEKGKINNAYFLSSLFGNEIDCYMELYRFDEAIQKGEQYLKHPKTDKMVRDLIAGQLAAAYMDREDYGKVLKYARYYWDGYQDYLRDEESFLGFVTNITGKCFEEHFRSIVLGHGIRAAVILGEGEQAWQWFDSFDWNATQIFLNEKMVQAIVRRMPKAEERERLLYVKMCNVMLGRDELETYLLQAISECCRAGATLEERVKAMAAYEGVQSGHWFFRLREIVLAADCLGRENNEIGQMTGDEAESLASEVWENPSLCMSSVRAYAMLDAMEQLGGSNQKVLEAIPFYRWEKGIEAYFSQFSWEDADWWNDRFSSIFHPENTRMLVWRAMYGLSGAIRAAGQLEKDKAACSAVAPDTTASDAVERDFDRIKKGMQEYASCQISLCEMMYRPEILSQTRDMLSEEYQGAYLMADLLKQTEAREYGQAVGTIKQIRKLLPGLDNIMKPYLQWIQEQLKRQEQESRQAAGEFQVLAVQIKLRLRNLLAAGQDQAALAIARQLQTLLPGDAEIRQIIEKLDRVPQ
ncbi:MAG TPA: hypothetical protein DCZ91_22705 [Lachnospiraceae bacterium]|nr:hypothetical protein [Lachnospiraceae bacterium]